ncbi:MAG TPA: N-acyl homoserine lactonase family protein [Acidimicrobiales bacterium]|nr:N-acyl homoserine lactonase family protein [Acidimicrobiales bacterium]
MKKPRRLYIQNHGNMHCDLGWLIAQAGVTLANRDQKSSLARQWVECPSHTVLIDHPDGWILWDTTVPRDWNTHWAGAGSNELFPYDDVKEEQYFDTSLHNMGLGVEDIKYVVQSHLHADHSGYAKHFKDTDATLICTKKEYDGAMGFEGPHFGVHIKADYADLKWTTFDTDQEIAEGVTLIQSPGHTWGTASLKVDLPDTGTMVFTSDAVYMTTSFGPPAVGSAVVNDSLAWLSSVENLRRIQKETDATMIFGHDAQQMKTLRFGPNEFYS